MPRAIEEILRFDGPVQSTIRFTKEDINLGGTDLPAQPGMLHNSRRSESRPRAVRGSRPLRHHARAARPRRARRGNPFLHRRAAGADGRRDRDHRDARALPAPAPAGSGRAGDLQRFLLPSRIWRRSRWQLTDRERIDWPQEVYFNIWDPEFRANPYPHYAPLLAGPPPIVEHGADDVRAGGALCRRHRRAPRP